MTGSPLPVVMGIIDDGIAFAHERFRLRSQSAGSPWETRVEYWWKQDGPYLQGPSQLLTGRELGKADIDALFAQCTRAGMLDEDDVYRRAGLIDFTRPGHNTAAWQIAHGTHVMDLACGYDSSLDRRDRPIVCVQLPVRVTENTSGAGLVPYAMEAVRYILRRARDIARARGYRRLPVVINFSYGYVGGPHDGSSGFEQKLDRLIARRHARGSTLDVIIPAGNSHLSRGHAQVSFESGNTAELAWRIQPDDRTTSEVEIWLPFRSSSGGSRLSLTVTPPGGPTSDLIDENSTFRLLLDSAGKPIGQVLHATTNGRSSFLIQALPTYDLDPAALTAPAGLWKIELTKTNPIGPSPVHVWIRRDESLYGYPRRGRQSYFEDPLYERYDHAGRPIEKDNAQSLVRRASLLNALATGRETIVVGGFVRSTRVLARYSAGGAITTPPGAAQPHRHGPDALAACEDSPAHGGVLAAGSRSGSVVAMNGTSVAAPQLARWIADERAKGITTRGRDLVKSRATPPPSDPERGGSGRIETPPLDRHPRLSS